jgi:histidinol-phosphate/aromatic aminotransferase/cobyric acid decarboxylase-like protein
MIDFTRPVNPCAPSGRAKQALRKGIRTLTDVRPGPLAALIRLLCRQEGVVPGNLLFGDGSTVILKDLLRIINPHNILLCAPLSTGYRAVLEGFTGGVAELPSAYGEGAAFDVDGFLRAARGVDMAIIGNPHAMTGMVPQPEDLRQIVEVTGGWGTTLLIDEACREFSGIPSPVAAATHSTRALIIRSFAPFHGFLDLPLGYLIGSLEGVENLRPRWASRRFSSLIGEAAVRSLRDKGFYRRTADYLAEEKQFVMRGLSGTTGLTVSDMGGNVLLIGFSAARAGVAPFCERRGILVGRFEDASGREYISFPIGKHRCNAALVRALKRFAEERYG